MSRNAQNNSLKNDVINEYELGLYACQKWIYQPEIWHAMYLSMALKHAIRIFEKLKLLNLEKSYIKNSVI